MQPDAVTFSLPILQQLDPLARQADGGIDAAGLSPLDPPDAYAPPGLDPVDLADLHPFLQGLCEEHALLAEALRSVEEALASVQRSGLTEPVESTLLGFCQGLARDFIPHSRLEERALFPLLHERLVSAGEHSRQELPTTGVAIMLDDHVKVIQLAAVVVNLLRLGPHLPDPRSVRVVRDAALRHAGSLAELLRLHMFREDKIVFAAAQRLLRPEELDALLADLEPAGGSGR